MDDGRRGHVRVVGIPMMTLIGEGPGWRWSFGTAALMTSMVWVLVLAKLPNPERVGAASGGILSRFKPLARLSLLYEISIITFANELPSPRS